MSWTLPRVSGGGGGWDSPSRLHPSPGSASQWVAMSGLFSSPREHQVTYFRLHGSVGEQRFELASPNSRVPSATLRWALTGVLPCLSVEAVLDVHRGPSPWDKWLHQKLLPECPLISLWVPLLGHACIATRDVFIHLCRCTHTRVVSGFLFSQFRQ